MNRLLLAALALALAAPALAQDGPYLHASYYECDRNAIADVDAQSRGVEAALAAHVAAGRLLAWGRMANLEGAAGRA